MQIEMCKEPEASAALRGTHELGVAAVKKFSLGMNKSNLSNEFQCMAKDLFCSRLIVGVETGGN